MDKFIYCTVLLFVSTGTFRPAHSQDDVMCERDLRRLERECDKDLKKLERELKKQDKYILKLEKEIKFLDSELKDADQALGHADKALIQADNALDSADRELKAQDKDISKLNKRIMKFHKGKQSIKIDRATWMKAMSGLLPGYLCSPERPFRTCYNVSGRVCAVQAKKAVKKCLKSYKRKIPDPLKQPEDGTKWGGRVDICATLEYGTVLKKKLKNTPECQ